MAANIYPIYSLDSGAVHVEWTPQKRGKQTENVIYAIDTEDQGSYVGLTARSLGDRFAEHALELESDSTSPKVYPAVRSALNENQNVTLRLLEQVPLDSSLEDREVFWINELDSYYNGLNSTRGSKPKKKREKPDAPYVPKKYQSPLKSYPFSRNGDRIVIAWTPSVRKTRSLIYRITDHQKYYLGQTERTLPERCYGHVHHANHVEATKIPRQLYRDIFDNPQNFSVGIVEQVDPFHLDQAESLYIATKDSCDHGYNGNHGKNPKKLKL